MSLRTLVICQAYDPSGPTVRTFYLTNGTPFITTPSETPASQSFDAVLSQPLDVRRRVQSVAGGSVRPTLGEVRLHNQDGAYDAWLGYAWDGRAIEVRVGPESGAYPSAYPVTFTGQIDRLDVQGDEIVVRVRDALAALDTPLADTLYAGDNVPPDGLEGGEELEGRVKPLAFGVVRNVPLVPVNTAKLIYQVSDSALNGVDDVYDNGVALGPYAPVDFSRLHTATGSNNYYCAETDGTTIVIGGGNAGGPAIFTTTDGVTVGVIGSLPFVAGGIVVGMAHDPVLDRWCAVTTGGEVATSDDTGATWTLRTPAAAAVYRNVRRCPKRGLFLAVGDTGVIHTSPTGVAWTAQTSGTTVSLKDVAVGGTRLIAVGYDFPLTTSVASRSFDGTTWGVQTLTAVLRDTAYWVDGWTFTQGSSNLYERIYRTRDADSWTDAIALDGRGGRFTSLREAGGYLVGVYFRGNSEYGVAVSIDLGLTWIGTAEAVSVSSSTPTIAIPMNDRWFIIARASIDRSGAPTQYANLTDLEDDDLAPVPGTYKWASDAAGSYVRLGTIPFGTITADATTGATGADRTAAQLFADVLTRAGYTASDWVAGDLTALDTADNSELGLFIDDETTVAEALDAIATSVGAWWGVDAAGDFRIQQLAAPSGSPTFTITANDIRGRLERLASSDPLLGLPSYRTSLRYALADTLTLDGTVVDTDTAVQTAHLLAGATVEDALYTTQADAQAECDRRQTLRGVMRSAYRVTVSLADYASVDLGAVGTLTHPRFGLSGGALVRVLGVEPDARNRSVTLTLWR